VDIADIFSIIEKFGRLVNAFLSCVAKKSVPGPMVMAGARADAP
jgi:hypothetical protein